MSELLYTVEKVFTEVLGKEQVAYNIPSYQRGYKWTSAEVKQLLEDIDNFKLTGDNSDQFYCLQNITLSIPNEKNEHKNELPDSRKYINVIDGQQRLTTMYILLRCLDQHQLVKGKLNYSVRQKTKEVLEGARWNTDAKPESIDMYYILEAAKTINEYLQDKDVTWKDDFKNKILRNVKFIVNTPDGNEEKIFATLNGGKISLDGADLIRAVIMTRSAKEFYGKSNNDEQIINEKRVRIGSELDEMNLWWGQSDVKTFFEQIIPDRIENDIKGKETFDNRMLPINILYKLFYLTHRKDDSIKFGFRFFEYGLDINGVEGDDHWELYEYLRKFHLDMQEWFSNQKIYHYIGYLFFNYKRESDFAELYKTYTEETISKHDFIDYLASKILTTICPLDKDEKDIKVDELEDPKTHLIKAREDKISEYIGHINEITHDWYNDSRLYSVLSLVDILYLNKGNQRLDVNYFTRLNKKGTKETEDKEHIGSQNPREESLLDKNAWERSINAMCIDESSKEVLLNQLKDASEQMTHDDLLALLKEITAIGLNSIGNIVLLHQKVNRSYGNSPFTDKRLSILKNFNEDRVYIRPYTLSAFMKGFQSGTTDRENNTWTLEDIKSNAQNISNLISSWMKQHNK